MHTAPNHTLTVYIFFKNNSIYILRRVYYAATFLAKCSYVLYPLSEQSKKDSFRSLSFLEKVFCFLWGVVKLYNVLGGYNVEYIVCFQISVHKLAQVLKIFLCNLSKLYPSLYRFHGFLIPKQHFKLFPGYFFFLQKKLCASVKYVTVFADKLLGPRIALVNNSLDLFIYG